MKRFLLGVFAALLLFGCASNVDKDSELPLYYTDMEYRETALLDKGMVYYGNDPQEEAFDDMYYTFIADAKAKIKASEMSMADLKVLAASQSEEDRAFLKYVFNDYADLAVMADYAYKDDVVELPDGWTDLAVGDQKLADIISKYTIQDNRPTGLKCSLMGKNNRRVLVFAGTDFPSIWTDVTQVMDFIVDAYEDVNGALTSEASQAALAKALVDELLSEGYVSKDVLEFAGHSLGGRLASDMAVKYGCPAVLFNAAGVSPDVYAEYEAARNATEKNKRGFIVDIVAANDPLTCAQKYMSGSSDPFVSATAKALGVDREIVGNLLSSGLDVLGYVSGEYVNEYYNRDYRALGAMMPIRENMSGHGIKPLAAALRARAELFE